jgi:hypothetical protein
MNQAAGQGFVTASQQALLQVDSHPEALLARIGSLIPSATGVDDYRKI